MAPTTFKCEGCGGEFEKGPDEEPDAEALENFGVAEAHTKLSPLYMAIVCDDCYQKMNAELPMKQWTAESPATRAYHQHLDICQQCERHPFDQCPVGIRLLRAAVDEQDRP